MSNAVPKVLVKVGKSSHTKLNNVEALRAVTFREAEKLLLLNPDIMSIVIEDVRHNEFDTAISLVNQAKSEGKYVFVYNANKEDNTAKFIQAIDGLDEVTDIQELHKKLTDALGVNVGETSNIIVKPLEKENYSGTVSTALNIDDNKLKLENIIETEIEHPNIDTKEDLIGLEEIDIDDLYFDDSKENSLDIHKEQNLIEMTNMIATLTKEKERLTLQLEQTMDRVKVLLDIKEALEDERDMYKDMLDNIDRDTNIIEDPVDIEEFERVKNELQQYKNKCDELNNELFEVNNQADRYKEEIDGLTIQIQELNEELKEAKSKISQYEDEINTLNIKINDLKSTVDLECRVRLKATEMLSDAIDENSNTSKILGEKNIEIENYKASVKNLESTIASLKINLQQLQSNYDYLIESQENQNEPKDDEIKRLTSELENIKSKYERLNNELLTKETQLQEMEIKLRDIISSSNRNNENYKKIIEANTILEETNKTLINNTTYLREENERLRKQLNDANDSIRNLEEANRQLKSSVINMSKSAIIGDKKIKINCEYTGRGYIIPVFGSGSYGITTTAVSIARKLSASSVLYLDFDMVNPKAERWFEKQPIIKELTGIAEPLMRTGLGALIEKGMDYVIDNEKLLFQRVVETKTGCLDYFSGLYTRVDITKLLSVNFTEFINYIGNTYKYIVVDLGRLGSSEIADAIADMFIRIAYKFVIVTLHDTIDTRNMGVKVFTMKLPLDNAIWILNIANNSKIDTLMARSMGRAKAVIMPKVIHMYGSGDTFDRVSATKDRLNEIIELLVG